LGTFMVEARSELNQAKASGDPCLTAAAEATFSLMSQIRLQHVRMTDRAFLDTSQVHKDGRALRLPNGLTISPKQKAVFVTSCGGFGDAADPAQVVRLNPGCWR